jgi:hypothetical protein
MLTPDCKPELANAKQQYSLFMALVICKMPIIIGVVTIENTCFIIY